MENQQYLLQMKGITKQFPGVLALDNVDLELNAGEILGLLGENGAGKSTLIKILSGAYCQDSGEIFIGGKPQEYSTPKEANERGVSIIYQELNYLNDLTVAENIFLNRWPRKKINIVDWKKMHADAKKILNELDVDMDTTRLMRNLSVAEKQLIEIGRALSQKMKILVMDEPTSALSDKEAFNLIELIKKLRQDGLGIIFISHRLDELFDLVDRVMVMRDGKRVGCVKMSQAKREELVQLMVGRRIESFYSRRTIVKGEMILQAQDVSTNYLKDISFSVRAGEILGIFGLMGSGRTELAQCIFGVKRMKSGAVKIFDRAVTIRTPKDAIDNGIAMVTSERKKDGLILIQTVRENVITASIDKHSSPFLINKKSESDISNHWKDTLNIKAVSIYSEVKGLSGGNQQKVVLAKWLTVKPNILILNEPTRGIDVGSKTEIYSLLETFCEQGLGIIMISSELPEIMQLSDRVMTMCEGRITAEFNKDEMTQEKLMHGAIGEI